MFKKNLSTGVQNFLVFAQLPNILNIITSLQLFIASHRHLYIRFLIEYDAGYFNQVKEIPSIVSLRYKKYSSMQVYYTQVQRDSKTVSNSKLLSTSITYSHRRNSDHIIVIHVQLLIVNCFYSNYNCVKAKACLSC